MLWTVRHLWPSRDFFICYCYCHWSLLVPKNRNCIASFMHSREGVIQGYPIAMVTYGIGIHPLIKLLKSEIPDVTQPCLANNDGALGTFINVELYFSLLKWFGPVHGCYTKPSKRILIVHPDNVEYRKLFGLNHSFNICTGARCLGGFIGDDKFKRNWLKVHRNK